MARNQAELTVGSSWVELSNANCTKFSFQIVSKEENGIFLRVTDGTTPTETYGWRYEPQQGEMAARMDSLVLNADTANRVFAKAVDDAVVVIYSDDS